MASSSKAITQRAALIPVLAEVFRNFGYEGASLARLGEATGLGKGSLYHLFPDGKDEMCTAVLADIDDWFQREVFQPLRDGPDPQAGIAHMFAQVEAYFLSGRKVCLVGVFALVNVRDRFAISVHSYFADWTRALQAALERSGHAPADAAMLAEEVVAAMQGGLVLARALDDPAVFVRTLRRWQQRLHTEPRSAV